MVEVKIAAYVIPNKKSCSFININSLLCIVTIDDLINRSEYELFKKVGYPCHSLHHLLPPYRTSDLRNRGHLFQLPEYTIDLHKKSFIIRTLYKYV